jgi:eukaryotic-like serine/threonine-protein kinase
VAVKVLRPELAAVIGAERFLAEIKLTANLQHPHILPLFDSGEADSYLYYVMPFVTGETLRDRMNHERQLPVAEAIKITVEVASALDYAHRQGVVHRDIKPENILLHDGSAVVADFGIALAASKASGARMTETGMSLGTPHYMSPEQAMGEREITARSDVYALGAVLYEMLTGEPPFRAESQVAVAMKHVREPLPDVQRLRPEISAALAAVVERATAKETTHRYTTVGEMVHDLEEVLAIEAARSGEATGEATAVLQTLSDDTADFAPVRLRHPKRVVFLTVLLLAVIGVAVWFLASRTEEGPGAGPVVAEPPGLEPVELASDAASDYDPEGDDGEESPEAANLVLDGLPNTGWDTETYQAGFEGANKSGVGLYVDAGRPIPARRLALVTSTPGFEAAVYASNTVRGSINGWQKVSSTEKVRQKQVFQLDLGQNQQFRNYLVWITQLPPDEGKAKIEEVRLSQTAG